MHNTELGWPTKSDPVFDGVLMALCDIDGNDPAVDDGHGSAGKRTAPPATAAGRCCWNSNALLRRRRRKRRLGVDGDDDNNNIDGDDDSSDDDDNCKNFGRLRSGRHGNDGARHAEDVDGPQQGEDGLDGRIGERWRRRRKRVVGRVSGALVQRQEEERVAGRPFGRRQCRLFVAVVGQSDGRRPRPAHRVAPSGRRARLVGRRALRLPSGPGRLHIPLARDRSPGSTRTGRFVISGESILFNYSI